MLAFKRLWKLTKF